MTPINELTHWTKRCVDWVRSTYGAASLYSLENRALRVLEEAVELAQAENISQEQVARVVARAYSRPVGEPSQEVAGTFFTLLVYARVKGVEPIRALATEVLRVEAMDPEHFRAKQQDKIAAGTELP